MSGDLNATVRQITRLARSGAIERAWSLLHKSGLAEAADNAAALALRARLEKDWAKRASGSERVRRLERSAGHYLGAAEITGASYPLINAATLSLLAGQRGKSEHLAQRVLAQLDANPAEPETPYWLGATRAEALLLLGRLPEARAALRAAVAEAPEAWEDRAATIGQFALICAELPCDAGWLDQLRPPRSVQYAGIMGVAPADPAVERRIGEWLTAENVGFGYGALAAGADIWIAEALLARGAELHVVLPCPAEVFRERSVAAVDEAWVPRFERVLAAAASVDELDAAPAPSPAAVGLTDAVALGLAVHNARILQSEALTLRVTDDRARTVDDAGPVRGATLAAARHVDAGGFAVGEAGAARAVLRRAGAAEGGESVEWFDGPAQAWAAARPLVEAGHAVAADCRFVGDGAGAPAVPERLDALAEVAEPGQVLASKAFAFALLAEAPAVRVEPMGEVRGAEGFFPFYALA